MLNLSEHPHRRFNPLNGEWVLVSPHRTKRPWQGQVEKTAVADQPHYDPECYLCPGNSRAGGAKNPDYKTTFVFDNDYAALLPGVAPERMNRGGLMVAVGEPGLCRVVCFSPRHDLTLGRMSREEILPVINVWAEQYRELGSRDEIEYVQIFENRGAMMGASNPHPHCQIWAVGSLPNEPAREQMNFLRYKGERGSCLLCDYVALEAQERTRVITENDDFVALVPFWAVWPFETIVISRSHVTDMAALTDRQCESLADILKRVTAIYDRVFEVSFPYTMGFHQKPTDGAAHDEWHLHAHFYPPLLRSATVRKFMVGYEMLAMPQRDITPEHAAERLRNIASTEGSER